MKHTIKLSAMKSIISVMILFSLVNSSCKKDHSNGVTPGGKLYALTYHVKGFSQSDTIFKAAKQVTSSIKTLDVPVSPAIIDVLYCKVYDANGKVVTVTFQRSTDANFGTIINKLSPGNYTIVFAGGKTGLKIATSYLADESSLDNDVLVYDGSTPEGGLDNTIKDTFYKKVSITVGNNDTQSVTLDRIVAQLAITIQDKLPANVKYITVVVQPWLNAFPVNGTNPYFNDVGTALPGLTTTIPTAKLGTSNYMVKTLIFTTASPFTVTLLAHNIQNVTTFVNSHTEISWNGVIAGKVLPNVTAAVNKTTAITGKLFGGSGTTDTGGFHIYINPDWNPIAVTIPF